MSIPAPVLSTYSFRRASIGLVRQARKAGTKAAANAVAARLET